MLTCAIGHPNKQALEIYRVISLVVTVRYEGMFGLCLYAITIYAARRRNVFSK